MDRFRIICGAEEEEDFPTEAERLNIRVCPCLGPRTYSHGVFYRRQPAKLPEPISAHEVRSRAEPMSRRVWANFDLLKVVVERYEAVIQRRWEKKSKVKRRQILNLACMSSRSHSLQCLCLQREKKIGFRGNIILTASRELDLQPATSSYGHDASPGRSLAEPKMWKGVSPSRARTRREEAFLHVATAQP